MSIMKYFFLVISILIASAASSLHAKPEAAIDSAEVLDDSIQQAENITIEVDHDDTFLSRLDGDDHDFSFRWIQLAGLVVPFVSAIAIIWLLLAYRDRRQRNKLHIIELSIIHKQPLPDSFFQSAGIDPQRRLLTGFYWVGAGAAISIFFALTVTSMWPIGLFPLFIGIGRIVVSRISSRTPDIKPSDNNTSSSDTAPSDGNNAA